MRLIDADVLKQHIDKLPALPDGNFAGNHSALKALINMQPTIQPEKTQLFREGTTFDTISGTETVKQLQGVLDVTVPITDYDGGYVDGVEFGISTVSTMPTIQSQSTEGQLNDGDRSTVQSTDLIDRQAAIDAAESAYVRNMFPTPLIREVPPAQPEPHEGHWIRVAGMNERCSACNKYFPLSYFTGRPFDINYCPNCGAKMKGVSNEGTD